jgi:single-strand DNA-binding protein
MNSVQIIGRLTADPELRQTQSGISCCRFTVAVNRKFKNKDTDEYEADFISCIAWRQTAEFVSRYFSKGKMIALTGTLHTGSYTDKNHSDVTHYTTDVFVENVEFCGDKGGNNNSNNNSRPQQQPYQQPAQAAPKATEQTTMSYGDLSDFEEILSDGDVPF